jgi:ADP-ribose pyrophosphatase YjhB (NUDIX family)
MRYCSQCGHALGQREVGGKLRPACPSCGAVVFEDPKLAVAVLLERDGGMLMGRRSRHSASPGKWSFPAGFVDRGERVEDAAVREVGEETGLEVRLDALLGLYSATGEAVVLAVYVGTVVGGTLRAADDLTELAHFPFAEPPEPAFPHDPQILADWLAWRARQGQCTRGGTPS